MGHKIVRIFDSVQITPPKELMRLDTKDRIKMMDNYISGVRKLAVTVAASHSGRITRNNGLYLPSKMIKGAKSLLSREDGGTSAYPKPVLVNHDRGGGGMLGGSGRDPIGRVRAAEYVDTSSRLVANPSTSYVKDMASDRPFYQFIDIVQTLMDTGALYEKDWTGLGFLRSTADITDPDAIEKFLDGRYCTVSTSASTDRAVCSVCREDWAELGEPCEHEPGKWYDGKKAFLIAGDLMYDEWSVATVPADEEAIVLQMDGVDANSNGLYTGPISDSYEPYELIASVQFKDNFDLSGGSSMNREDMLAQLKEMWPEDQETHFDKIDDSVSDDTIKSFLETEREAAPSFDDFVSAFELKIEDTNPDNSPEHKEDCAGCGSGDSDKSDKLSVDDWEKIVDKMLSEDSLSEEEADILYEMMATELSDMAKEIVVTNYKREEENIEDAKLSSGARKKLAASSFCGPDRSFPVNDCAHCTAARRLLGRYNGSGNKDSISACIERKCRTLGCNESKKDTVEVPSAPQAPVDIHTAVEAALSEMDDTAVRALYVTVEGAITERRILPEIPCDKCTEKDTAITGLEGEKTELTQIVSDVRHELELSRQDVDVLMEQLADSHSAQKTLLSTSIASMKKVNGEKASFVEIRDSMASKSLSDLKKAHNELRDQIDFDNIKLGSSDVPRFPDPIEDPTIQVDSGHTPSSDYDMWVPQVKKRYNELLIDGKAVAEHYLMEMKRGKFVPADFTIMDDNNDD